MQSNTSKHVKYEILGIFHQKQVLPHTPIIYFFPDFLFIQVMTNQESVDIAVKIRDPQKAAKQLVIEALCRESKDDISCVVVQFKG